ncbi:molybdopterin-guanine dinucleotide biosynthesis protein B [Saccharolobus solfataricus]|uniref:Molybdopterin-guanine dinucleotide biosynthesis protein B (MobB) n=3 Tax=Saccharolobus solfataricus TaxID=2287 RepID=Q7LXN5_SACS2|nr:molybdopterin-guanine dinucleotide biosynthesis protein B [Saccharolobus solfataricus]AAK40977.1 Molybdopterin-guanine dinucleotide biosynthesis protein B (mobB) [Saccharolobus solfataricus P2]AKA74006.1 molybdopterin-guanine dinucleotide biosynthesis protein B [Saccharolobus solfataricus]AKA76703.1 molybdopterin-guanine dinucleotide biosynthesis protein B [Saccharolobus solfataricus]AKA79397.1 molybdopterin-guanine dinucleotide biosynthesis protein B [Saccharolobus solfataricus]AZF68484.1 
MACIFHIIGKKDTGKTSVIESVLREIKKDNLKVAVVKHSHHKLDLAGKDTYRYRNSGSDLILFQEGEEESVLFMPSVSSLTLITLLPVDVILVEGFSNVDIGKKYIINNVNEVEAISKQVINDIKKECQKTNRALILDNVKVEVTSDNALLLTLYNLMKVLGVKNVSSD